MCECDGGWRGAGCESRSCAYGCHSHGQCVDGTCYCAPGWEGETCDVRSCPSRCSAHGACLPSGFCACFDGWDGDDCSEARDELSLLGQPTGSEQRRNEQGQEVVEEMRAAAFASAARRSQLRGSVEMLQALQAP